MKTEISQYKNLIVSGYMLNVGLNENNQQQIGAINQQLVQKFGDAIIPQQSEALHITLMDWVAPLVTYDRDKDVLFKEIFPQYDDVLSKLTANLPAFSVTFDILRVSPAAIYIEGHDNGQFQSLRDDFVGEIELLPGTKQPPKIVHCTIVRFGEAIEVTEVEKFAESLSVRFDQSIDGIRLVHEMKAPMLSFDLVKQYKLA